MLLERFYEVNAPLAHEIVLTKPLFECKTLLELALHGKENKNDAVAVQHRLMEELKSYTKRPVFYIFDEHQKLLDPKWGGIFSPTEPHYFSEFTTFGGRTSGVTFLLLLLTRNRRELLLFIADQQTVLLKIIFQKVMTGT